MTEVDLSQIRIEKILPSIVIEPKNTQSVNKLLRKYDLQPQFLSFKQVVPEKEGNRILLREGVTELPEELQKITGTSELTPHRVFLDYRNLSLPDLLRTQIPEPIVIPTAFETIGTIAHLNLLDEQMPYKHLIGQAILLKNSTLKTVVTKIGQIHNVYRSMDLEILAGEPQFETEVRQGGFKFQMDFSKVYWNTRLENEHNELADIFTPGSIVADAMCGIGPFVIRAAKNKNCKCLANDLNPDSYKWLKRNIEINGVSKNIECFNMDAREFIKKVFREGGCDYIVMNLPKTAVEFLDAVGEAAMECKDTARMPIVYFHAFDSKKQDAEESLLARARAALHMELPKLTVKKIRDVSPGKYMYRCSFPVTDLFAEDPSEGRSRPT